MSVLLKPSVNAQLRHFVTFFTMKRFLEIFIIVIFSLVVRGHSFGMSKFNSSNAIHREILEGLEVPDSALLLLNGLKLSRNHNISYFARQNQEETEEEPEGRCKCSLGVCQCCTGALMYLLGQKACVKVAYHPGDFAFDVTMLWNDEITYQKTMSGKNPQPICVSPRRLPNLKFCARFYNIFFPGRNFHFCLALTGKWRSAELFNYAFDCLRMGANGVAMVKPDAGGGLPIPNPQGGVDAIVDAGNDDIEEYDENVVRSLLDLLPYDK